MTYQFEPGADADGVTVHIPLQVLNQVTADGFDWQIPGLREEVVTELIRSLPKPIRRHYVPAPNYAKALPGPRPCPLQEPLPVDAGPRAAADGRRAGRRPRTSTWRRVPDHLKITFRIVDERRRKLAEDKDLEALRLQLQAEGAPGPLPGRRGDRGARGRRVHRAHGPDGLDDRHAHRASSRPGAAGQPVKAYPALVDEGDDRLRTALRHRGRAGSRRCGGAPGG